MAESVDPRAELRAKAEEIATELNREASIAARNGQMALLERLAGRVLELERSAGYEIARFRVTAFRLQRQIDEVRKVHDRLLQSADHARNAGDSHRAMAYDDAAAQIRTAPFIKIYSGRPPTSAALAGVQQTPEPEREVKR